ncbi:MAG TPA: phosphoserine transaminase [Nitriliruptorales bacterium]
MAPDLSIPADLLPADGRFGCGPSKVPAAAVAALAARGTDLLGTSHRQPAVRQQVARLRRGVADLFSIPDGHEVLIANGGATAFWDMAAHGLIRRRSRHESFGEFSSKFAAAAARAPWLEDPDLVEAPPGQRPSVRATGEGVDVVGLTHNETSTGVATEILRPSGDALVLVDATSGAGGLPVDVAETDVYYFSPQKGLAAEGGLVIAIASPAALERIDEIAASGRYVPAFLDLATVVDNSRKEQTYNTPSIATIFLAAEQVDAMNAEGGLETVAKRCAARAESFYAWALERPWAAPFVTDPDARSAVVATIDLDGVSADDVNAVLRANGIVDTDSYRKLGRNQLRIGMFPAVDTDDLEAYRACVDWIVERL